MSQVLSRGTGGYHLAKYQAIVVDDCGSQDKRALVLTRGKELLLSTRRFRKILD